MARVKKKEHEKLSDENVRKVISLLQPSDNAKPISKKEACQILNISYNVARLQKIIEEFESRQKFVASQKAANRGKHATKQEISQAIFEYLQGENISSIAKRLFRSPGFVKAIIERIGVPQKPSGATEKSKIALLPDACYAEEFREGELVWSAAYHKPAIVKHELSKEYQKSKLGMKFFDYEKVYGAKVYHIKITESVDAPESYFPFITKGGFSAFVPAYDLGKLEHLAEYGVMLDRI